MCDRRWADGPLVCTLDGEHDHGPVYVAGAGALDAERPERD